MHHHCASKFLTDSLSSHGFCSPYTVVQTYELRATVSQRTDIPVYTPDIFVHHVVDNVDHSIRTLEGSGTFHGMGIIATMTPGIQCRKTGNRRRHSRRRTHRYLRVQRAKYGCTAAI